MKSAGNECAVRSCLQMLHVLYFLLPRWEPATWRFLALAGNRAEFPTGNVPAARIPRRISRFSCSSTSLVRVHVQCSPGKPLLCPVLFSQLIFPDRMLTRVWSFTTVSSVTAPHAAPAAAPRWPAPRRSSRARLCVPEEAFPQAPAYRPVLGRKPRYGA